MDAILLTTTTSQPLGRKCLLSSLHSISNGPSSILTTKLDKKNRIRLTKPPFIHASLSKRTGETSAKAVAEGSVTTLADQADPPVVSWQDLQYDAGYLGARPQRPPYIDEQRQTEYLTGILSAKVYDLAIETPLNLAPQLSESLKVNIWLKREDTQQVFSFKLRGAYNMMAKLPKELLKQGVICASAGNHAQGVALSAKRLKCRAVVVMPTTTPEIKWKAVERLGGEVIRKGDTFDDAQAYARQLSEDQNLTFIPPFNDQDVIMGQGTAGMEIARQMRGQLRAIFVPVGGGGLIAGIASFFKKVYPEVMIIGVEPNDANSMASSLDRNEIVIVDDIGHFADGVAVKQVGDETFRICRELIDGVVLVDKDAISAAIKDVFNDERSIVEPSGALALAGAKAYCKYYGVNGGNVVAVTSGANMNFDQLGDIADNANFGLDKEAMLASLLPEERGSLKKFIDLLGSANITEFSYRFNSDKEAIVRYNIGAGDPELAEVLKRFKSSQITTYNLTDNAVAKTHFRYMMGGKSNVENEVLCRFVFPERPGALSKFLEVFCPRWNITLFNYRSQGIISADVLVGFQAKDSEVDEFHSYAKKAGLRYKLVDAEDVSKILL